MSMFLYKNKDSSFFSAFIDVISSIFMCRLDIFMAKYGIAVIIVSMTLTAALFITLGFNVWCGEMTRRFENCADATENDIDRAEGIDPKGFFMQMFTAQFGIWLSWAIWVGLTVFALLKLCRYHQQENIRVNACDIVFNSNLKCYASQVSMAKERKRLINEDLVTDVGPGAVGGAVGVTGQPGRDNPGQDSSSGPGLRGNQIVLEAGPGAGARPDLLN